MRRALLVVLCLLLTVSPAFAKITLSTPRSSYVFPTGVPASVPIVTNDTGSALSGQLTITGTQRVQQGGFSYESTNSNTQPLALKPGVSNFSVGLGNASRPVRLTLLLVLRTSNATVSLGPINVSFVNASQQQRSQSSQQQQSQQRSQQSQQSKPLTSTQSSSQRSQQRSSSSQQQQQGSSQQSQPMPVQRPQNAGQALTGHQMNADTNALKARMARQHSIASSARDNLSAALNRSSAYRNASQKLAAKGFTRQGRNYTTAANRSGNVTESWTRGNDTATITARVQNGTVTSVRAQDRAALLAALEADPRYVEMRARLARQGYALNSTSFATKNAQDSIVQSFAKPGSQPTASISALERNATVTKVSLAEPHGHAVLWAIASLLLAAALAVAIVAYARRRRLVTEPEPAPTPEAYRRSLLREARECLDEASRVYPSDRVEGFRLAGRALRLALIVGHGFDEEMTNEELVSNLPSRERSSVEQLLATTDAVAFGGVSKPKRDFDRVRERAARALGDLEAQERAGLEPDEDRTEL